MLKKMDTRKLLTFCQLNFFSDKFIEVLTFIDKFHYFSSFLLVMGEKTIFCNGSKTKIS